MKLLAHIAEHKASTSTLCGLPMGRVVTHSRFTCGRCTRISLDFLGAALDRLTDLEDELACRDSNRAAS